MQRCDAILTPFQRTIQVAKLRRVLELLDLHLQLCKQPSISSAEMTASHLKLLTVFPILQNQ